MPAVFATAEDPTPIVLCGQGTAPRGATIEHFRGLDLDLVPGSGPLAAAIPGAVDAWLMLGRDHGTRSLRRVLSLRRRLREAWAPAVAQGGCDRRGDGADVHRALADVGGPLDPRRSAATCVGARRQPGVRRRPRPAGRRRQGRGADREAQFDAARRAWREGFVAEAVDTFQRRPFQDSSGRAPRRRAHRR